MLASGNTLPNSRHPLVRQQSDTARQVLSRQESGSSRGVPDPSASLDAIHPADRASPHTSGINGKKEIREEFKNNLVEDFTKGEVSGTGHSPLKKPPSN